MEISKKASDLVFRLFSGERLLLESILQQITLRYQSPLDSWESSWLGQWMNLDGVAPQKSGGDRDFWQQHWEWIRSEREETCGRWLKELSRLPHESGVQWKLPREEVEVFLQCLPRLA
ncbi:MAG: hypothetical protein HC904_07990 [Blastochloris sp.]|nr:hypothetical protein [Blastochloris sp.]